MADTQIDSLSIQISSDAQQATYGIERLANTLEKLKTSVTGNSRGLNNLAKSMQGLASIAKSIDKNTVSAIANMVTTLKGLTSLGELKINASVPKNLGALVENIRGIDDATVDRIRKLADALREIGSVDGSSMRNTARGAEQMTRAFSRGTGQTGSPAENVRNFFAGFRNIRNTIRDIKMGVGFMMKFIDVSNDYMEDLNLYSVSMGEFAQQGFEFAQKAGDLMGIDPGEFMKYQGVFMTISKGLGVASDRAAIMSQNLTQLGYDLASLYNVDFATAMQRLQSGLVGQIKGMRQFGYDVSDVAVNQAALALGIDKTTDAMNQAEKAELRYYLMMTNVTWAQNDMARTLNQPANQLRVFKAQLTQVARAIGNLFIPILNAVLPILTAIAAVLKTIINTIGGLFGFQLPEVDYSASVVNDIDVGTEDIADNLGEAAGNAKKMKDYLLSIDELNVLNPDTGSGSGSGSGGGAGGAGLAGGGLGFDLPTYDFFNGLVESKASKLTEKLKEWLGIAQGINSWTELWDSNLGKILEIVGGIGGAIAGWKIFTAVGADGLIGLTLGVSIAGITMMFKNGVDPTNSILSLIGASLFGARAGWKIVSGITAGGGSLGMGGGLASSLGMSATTFGAVVGTIYAAVAVVGIIQMAYVYQHPESDWGKHFANVGLAPNYEADAWGRLLYGDEWERQTPTIDKFVSEVQLDKVLKADPQIKRDLDGITQSFTGIIEQVQNMKKELETMPTDEFNQSTKVMVDGMTGGMASLGESIGAVWSDLRNNGEGSKVVSWWKTNITDKLGSAFGNLSSTVSNSLAGATSSSVNSMTNGWNAFITGLGTVVNALISGLSTVMSSTWNSWKSLYRGLGFSDEQIAQMGNGTLTSWDYSQYLINKWSAPANIVKPGQHNPTDPRYQTKAAGGFVNSGQMFIAREAGAELVGTIGNRTAVVNNDQIVESVSAGVYDAVMAALGGSQQQGDIVVQIDGREIYRASQRAERSRGYNLGMGAFA